LALPPGRVSITARAWGLGAKGVVMTTATARTSWPTSEELARIEGLVTGAHHGLNELELSCYRFVHELEQEVVDLPSFDELGRISRFIACIEADIDGMQAFMKHVREAHHSAAVRLSPDDAS
jgi:hypothetical protein